MLPGGDMPKWALNITTKWAQIIFYLNFFLNLLQISQSHSLWVAYMLDLQLLGLDMLVFITMQEIDMPDMAQLGMYHQRKGTRWTSLLGPLNWSLFGKWFVHVLKCNLFRHNVSYRFVIIDTMKRRAVNRGHNPKHLLQLSIYDRPLMLQVNWPVVDTIYP